jgi:hypothetical protein
VKYNSFEEYVLSINKTSKVLIKYCWNISIVEIENLSDVFAERSEIESFLVVLKYKHFEKHVFVNKTSEILLLARSVELITELFKLLDVFKYLNSKEYSIIEKPICRELIIY